MRWGKVCPALHAGGLKGRTEPVAESNAESSVTGVQGTTQRAEEDGVVALEEGRSKPCACTRGSTAVSVTLTGTHDAALRSTSSSLLFLNLLYMETSQSMIVLCVLRRCNAGEAPAAVGGPMFWDAFMRGERRPARPLQSETFVPGSAMAQHARCYMVDSRQPRPSF